MKNTWKMLAGAAMMSMAMLGTGCESSQHRHDHKGMSCCGECSGEGKECCGQCGGEKAGSCCGSCGGEGKEVACSHMNAKIDCKHCKAGEPCCSGCAAKMAAACPDCKGKDS